MPRVTLRTVEPAKELACQSVEKRWTRRNASAEMSDIIFSVRSVMPTKARLRIATADSARPTSHRKAETAASHAAGSVAAGAFLGQQRRDVRVVGRRRPGLQHRRGRGAELRLGLEVQAAGGQREHGGALRRLGNEAITTVLEHDDNPSDGSSNYASVRGVDAMAVDELGNVFFAENDDGWTASYGRLRRLDVNNDVWTWLPRDGRTGSPTYGQNVNLMINCMAMAPDGSLYMSLSSNFADHDEIVVMR